MLKLLTCARGHFWEALAESESDSTSRCPECGAPSDAFPSLDPAPAETLPPVVLPVEPPLLDHGRPVVAGYEILEDLGKGPTGVRLYRAKQQLVNREVLLEVVLAREDSTQRAWSSLRSQAGALGRLSHPCILPVHEVGERDRQLFYNVLTFVTGPTLAQKVTDRPLSFSQVARLVELLARALEHAHEQGLLHRNLEPGKILLQPMPAPKDEGTSSDPGPGACMLHSGCYIPCITGFGLARRPVEGDPTDAELYAEPGYLSPEQAWGRTKELAPATDVYALGGLLYFLLTGRPPFRGPSLGDIIDAIQTADLVPPSAIRRVPADLEAICTRALSRQPRRRYASAGEMADDLRRLASHRPVKAMPSTAGYRLGRWLRRRPGVAGVLLTGFLGLTASLIAYHGGQENASQAGAVVRQFQQERDQARQDASNVRAQLNVLAQRERFREHRERIAQVLPLLASGNRDRARILLDLCPVADRQFEWHYLRRRLGNFDPLRIETLLAPLVATYHPRDSRVLVFAGPVRTGDRTQDEVRLIHARSQQPLVTVPILDGKLQALALSPDGRSLAILGGERGTELLVYTLQDGVHKGILRFRLNIPGNSAPTSVAWSPDPSRLVVATGTGSLFRVQASNGQLIGPAFGQQSFAFGQLPTTRILADPNGQLFTSNQTESQVRLWHTATGRFLASMNGPGTILALACNQFKQVAIARSDDSVRVHETVYGRELVRLGDFPGHPRQLAFSPDGRRLAIACADGKVRLWGTEGTGWEELLTLSGDGTSGLSFSPDGRALAAAGPRETTIWGEVLE